MRLGYKKDGSATVEDTTPIEAPEDFSIIREAKEGFFVGVTAALLWYSVAFLFMTYTGHWRVWPYYPTGPIIVILFTSIDIWYTFIDRRERRRATIAESRARQSRGDNVTDANQQDGTIRTLAGSIKSSHPEIYAPELPAPEYGADSARINVSARQEFIPAPRHAPSPVSSNRIIEIPLGGKSRTDPIEWLTNKVLDIDSGMRSLFQKKSQPALSGHGFEYNTATPRGMTRREYLASLQPALPAPVTPPMVRATQPAPRPVRYLSPVLVTVPPDNGKDNGGVIDARDLIAFLEGAYQTSIGTSQSIWVKRFSRERYTEQLRPRVVWGLCRQFVIFHELGRIEGGHKKLAMNYETYDQMISSRPDIESLLS